MLQNLEDIDYLKIDELGNQQKKIDELGNRRDNRFKNDFSGDQTSRWCKYPRRHKR